MKNTIVFLLLLVSLIANGQNDPLWMRYPTISPDGSQIVFTYKGDLYKVDATGGDATQITFHDAHDFMAVWSKDGSRIAFASNRYGNFDIYIMNANGGAAERLTFHSANESPFSFTADDQNILFGALRQDGVNHR